MHCSIYMNYSSPHCLNLLIQRCIAITILPMKNTCIKSFFLLLDTIFLTECEHNGEYKTWKAYYSEDCTKKCFCMSPDTPEKFTCIPSCYIAYLACHGPKVTYQRPIPGTKCTCPVQKCVPYEGKGKVISFLCYSV